MNNKKEVQMGIIESILNKLTKAELPTVIFALFIFLGLTVPGATYLYLYTDIDFLSTNILNLLLLTVIYSLPLLLISLIGIEYAVSRLNTKVDIFEEKSVVNTFFFTSVLTLTFFYSILLGDLYPKGFSINRFLDFVVGFLIMYVALYIVVLISNWTNSPSSKAFDRPKMLLYISVIITLHGLHLSIALGVNALGLGLIGVGWILFLSTYSEKRKIT